MDAANALDMASEDMFEEAYDRAEQAREAFERSRLLLKQHVADHGC